MTLTFSTGEALFQGETVQGALTELDNAVLAFFWVGKEPLLGTLTVTLPDKSSSPLLGDRDQQISLILGAQLAAQTGKMALVSTNIPVSMGNVVGKTLLDLVREILGDRRGKDE